MRHHVVVKLVVEYEPIDGQTPVETAEYLTELARRDARSFAREVTTRHAMVAHASHGAIYPGPAPYAAAHLEPVT